MISPGSDASGVSFPRTLTSSSRPEMPFSTRAIAIVAEGGLERGGEVLVTLDLGDADARAEVRGLDEERQGQRPADAAEELRGVRPPLRFAHDEAGDDGQAAVAEDRLGQGFVHAQGRPSDARPDIGDAGHLEQPLDGAVFAEGAVEDGEIDVDLGSPGRGPGPPGEERTGRAGLESPDVRRGRFDGLPEAAAG